MKEECKCACCCEEENKSADEEIEIEKLENRYNDYRSDLRNLAQEKTEELIRILGLALESINFGKENEKEVKLVIEKLEKLVR